MEWLEVHIDTNHAGLEPLEIFLSANGVDGVVIDDEQDFQSFLENNHQYWDYVDEDLEASMKGKSRITFYLPADGDGFDQLAHLRTALQGFKDAHAGKYGTLLMTLENLKDADWENNWKQYYKPMEIGERLLVIPEWEQENVKGQAKYAGKVPLILEPGLTFGTGSHHPPVPDSAGRKCSRRRNRIGSGLRQRHPLHCRAAAGRRLRQGCGH